VADADPTRAPLARLLKAIYRSRRTTWLWVVAAVVLIALAVAIPNTQMPVVTSVSLIAATVSGYLAPAKRAVFFLAAAALVADYAIWADASEIGERSAQWLGVTAALTVAAAAVVYYVRELEERAWEFRWRAEVSADAAELGVFRWDFATDFVQTNARLRSLFGLPQAGPIFGEDIFLQIAEDDLDAVKAEVERARNGEAEYRAEFRVRREDGAERWLAARGRVIIDPRSGRKSLAGVNYDVTDAKESAENFQKLIDGVAAIVALTDEAGEVMELNRFARDLSGLAPSEAAGAPFWELGFWGGEAESRRAVQAIVQKARRTGEEAVGEATFRREDGTEGHAHIVVTPLKRGGGVVYLVPTALDITKRKIAEDKNVLLVRELNHRIKNLFSVTSALISLSARYATSVDEFSRSTLRRLSALHEAHNLGATDLLTRRTNLKTIIDTALQPWTTDPPRIVAAGDDVDIAPGEATAWALIVHELATNANKYGALSADEGRLDIRWTHTEEDGVAFVWKESGVALKAAAISEGFGATIIRRLAAGYLQGGATFEMEPDGVRVTIESHPE